ncbi:unnamed protein product [Darwinula stevensoni]|uniref:Uncharacterized protein n=1 Tax=Darwinula stevensoni TaxID=69355 RepID=A0A7R9A6Y5_9CRUS|nr:unnamed protein product [Darwinula stevensoni]CAG0896030.1 unnamed protein product [Darwinula stevensoni]
MSHGAARCYSAKVKDELKKIIIEEGEDMGSQLPIVIARGMTGEFRGFDPKKRNEYIYEVVAGQHIVTAKKEINKETVVGKDTCMCAVYMGVTEKEKMDLALHNATLQAVPYNVLDVDEKKHRVLKHLVRMGSEVVKAFLDVARTMENDDRGSVEKKLHHLRGLLGNHNLTTTDFLDNLQFVKDGVCGFAELRQKLELAVRMKTLRTSFASIANEDEDVIVRAYSECVSNDALRPFLKMKQAESSKEWNNYVQVCLECHGTKLIQTSEKMELKSIPETPMEVKEGSIHRPFCAAILSIQVIHVNRCLLGILNHQGRNGGEKGIPIAFVTDSLCEAAKTELALQEHNLKTQSAVLSKARSKGPLFVQAHRYCVIGSSSEVPLSTSIVSLKELLDSFGKPNQWILSNVEHLKDLDVSKSMKILSPVDLDVTLEEEMEKCTSNVQEDPLKNPEQGEHNSSGNDNFELETESPVGDKIFEEYLKNEDTNIFGHEYIDLWTSSLLSFPGINMETIEHTVVADECGPGRTYSDRDLSSDD